MRLPWRLNAQTTARKREPLAGISTVSDEAEPASTVLAPVDCQPVSPRTSSRTSKCSMLEHTSVKPAGAMQAVRTRVKWAMRMPERHPRLCRDHSGADGM